MILRVLSIIEAQEKIKTKDKKRLTRRERENKEKQKLDYPQKNKHELYAISKIPTRHMWVT